MKRFLPASTGTPKECTTRMENLMREDPEMMDRLERAQERERERTGSLQKGLSQS